MRNQFKNVITQQTRRTPTIPFFKQNTKFNYCTIMKTILFGLTILSVVLSSAYGVPPVAPVEEEVPKVEEVKKVDGVGEKETKYTDRYDNINIDEILENKRLLNNYVDCILDKGRCTAEGDELKKYIADALQTKCTKCTEKQRKGVEKVIRHLVNKEYASWEELCKKYDPDSKYRKEYEDAARKYGIEKL